MSKTPMSHAEEKIINSKRKKLGRSVIAVLCAFVVLITAYIMIIPGTAMTSDNHCGLDEHKHTEECYSLEKKCEFGDAADEIGDKVLVCGIEENKEPSSSLVCEKEVHQHSEECYDEQGELICEKEEHIHTDECYAKNETHIHNDACYHIHTEKCFENVMTCEREEHKHTLQCGSDPSKKESKADWESTLSSVKLTGEWREDLAAIAETQIGYKESTVTYTVAEDGKTIKGYTRYGDWYGDEYADWSAMFVSFCFNYAGIKERFVPRDNDCEKLRDKFKNAGMYEETDDFTPLVGDIAFIADDKNTAGFVGVVDNFDEENETIDLIIGDKDDCVKKVTYKLSDDDILGYGAIPENRAAVSGALMAAAPLGAMPYNPAEDSVGFEHNKTIDYLNDGTTNPDTTLSGEDYYRLYLDMTGKQEPMDLLFVVDGSGSMNKTDMEGGMRRDTAITQFLNGSTTRSTANGFLNFFLSLNSENRVSVVQFYGTNSSRNTNYVSTSNIDYTFDSKTLLDWTGTNKFVNCTCQTNSGTNYEAGLYRADEQFSKVVGDNHRKIMIFLSDGVPTFFNIDANDVGTVCNRYTLKNSDVGKRWGTGSYTSTSNYPYCKDPSKKAFDDFVAANPGTMVFTVGVSKDISETSQSESQSPEVLKYMAEHGKGAFFSIEDSMADLQLQLASIFYPKGVTITDDLSKYVRYYGDKPDPIVTMTNRETGEVTVLYRNGRRTTAGRGIFDKVVYTPADTADEPTGSTGTVKAVFDPEYQFSPEYTYTLSFNVKVTDTAYQEYAESGYNRTGEGGTDYGTNTTSSNKAGFRSNTSAAVDYSITGSQVTEYYKHPVVQVSMPELADMEIIKEGEDGKFLAGAQFALYKGNDFVKNVVTDKNGKATVTDLEIGETYKLKETKVPDGYTVPTKDDTSEGTKLDYFTLLVRNGVKSLVYTAEAFYTDGTHKVLEYDGNTACIHDNELTVIDPRLIKLTIKKIVEGEETQKAFPFKISYTLHGGDVVELEPFELRSGEEKTITLPYKAVVTVNETEHDGYSVTIKDGDNVLSTKDKYTSAELTNDKTITVYNLSGYKLPQTGGEGTLPFVLAGIMLTAAAATVLVVLKKHSKAQ